ncbi:MAG: lysophospholipid acyltransferase family protein [Devosia sp.]
MSGTSPLSTAQRASIDEARNAMLERMRQYGVGKRALYLFQAAFVFPIFLLVSVLPLDWASSAAAWFGRNVMARLLYFNRAKMRRTMRVPFPKLTDAECDGLVAAMSDNVMRTIAELAHLERFAGRNNPRLVLKGEENLSAAKKTGRPVLFLACHFANWEVAEVSIRSAGMDGVAAVQHPNNPYLLGWLARQRYKAGLSEQIGTGRGVYRAMRRALAQGRAAALLCDQRVGNGIKAPFFGLETTTNVIPARLARTTPAITIPVTIRRLGGARFEVNFLPQLEFEHSGNSEGDERAFLARVHRIFEAQILEQPAHWLWLNPRWDDVLLPSRRKPRRAAAN